MAQVRGDVGVGAIVVGDGRREECRVRLGGDPVAPGGEALAQGFPGSADAAPVSRDYTKASDDDRRGSGRLGLLCQLAKFLIEKFVLILLASPEHEGTRGGRKQRENAEQLLHSNVLLAPRPQIVLVDIGTRFGAVSIDQRSRQRQDSDEWRARRSDAAIAVMRRGASPPNRQRSVVTSIKLHFLRKMHSRRSTNSTVEKPGKQRLLTRRAGWE